MRCHFIPVRMAVIKENKKKEVLIGMWRKRDAWALLRK